MGPREVAFRRIVADDVVGTRYCATNRFLLPKPETGASSILLLFVLTSVTYLLYISLVGTRVQTWNRKPSIAFLIVYSTTTVLVKLSQITIIIILIF